MSRHEKIEITFLEPHFPKLYNALQKYGEPELVEFIAAQVRLARANKEREQCFKHLAIISEKIENLIDATGAQH